MKLETRIAIVIIAILIITFISGLCCGLRWRKSYGIIELPEGWHLVFDERTGQTFIEREQ